MFAQLVRGKNRSGRRNHRRRSRNRAGSRLTGFGRAARFESLEDRRMLSAGDLDPTFGDGGIVITPLPGDPPQGAGNAVALQSDGKIVAVGFTRSGTDFDSVIARYLPDGSLDATFGTAGIVVTDISTHLGRDGRTSDVAIDDQGRILVAGGFESFVLARYLSDGTLDTTFAGSGISNSGSASARGIEAIAIQPDGKIVAAGRSFFGGAGETGGDFTVLRYNSDGSLDTSFGAGGLVSTDFGARFESAQGVAIDSSGRIVVVGDSLNTVPTFDRQIAVARYNMDGSLDSTFDVDGKLKVNLPGDGELGRDVVVDVDGKIVVAGGASNPGTSSAFHTLLRLNDNGTLDADFDSDGVALSLDSGFSYLRSLELQSDGKIVAVGSNGRGFVGRWNTDGTFDTTFGGTGKVSTNLDARLGAASIHAWNDVVLEPNGKIVTVGVNFNDSDVSPNNIFGLARYLGDCDEPVSSWQAEGDALDSEGRNDGQLLNGATIAAGQIGQAFEFDGINDAVQIFEDGSELDGFSELAITAWINPANFASDVPGGADVLGANRDAIVTKIDTRAGAGWSYTFSITHNGNNVDGGNLQFFVNDQNNNNWSVQSDNPVINVGEWVHVAAVWRGDNDIDLYVNGSIVPSTLTINGSPSGLMADNDTPVNIGRYESSSGSLTTPWAHFEGLIDDVRIYSCGLDDAKIQEIYLEGAIQPVNVRGRVFDDANNDGSDAGDTGLGGLTVTLTGSDDQGPVNLTTLTLADGSYVFEDVLPGTYSVTADQPVGLLDGKETAGNLGGTVDNTLDSNVITGIVIGTDGVDATGYNFANIQQSDLMGLVWQDFNNDGEVNFGEKAIENVAVALSGTDDRGNAVNLPTQTDIDGVYMFVDLRPGDYTLTETQPAGFDDGLDIVGTVDGVLVGDNSVNDVLSGVVLVLPGSVAENYNFGERPPAGGAVTGGQTATIGFWQNNNGQALIESLNGGPGSTQLSSWLSTTFVNMYGDDGVGGPNANDLSGMTNVEVADFYSDLFRRKKKEAVQLGLGGPVKMDAQVMAVALATYVTNQSLAGLTAESFGFLVTENGVGTSTFNVGDGGEAFDVADNTDLLVLDLLFATNENSIDGVLYDTDGDGDADDDWETVLRTLANDVFSAINESGGV